MFAREVVALRANGASNEKLLKEGSEDPFRIGSKVGDADCLEIGIFWGPENAGVVGGVESVVKRY